MKSKLFQHQICVKPSSVHGYGVFALADISVGEVVEECCVISSNTRDPLLNDYGFLIDNKVAFLTGYGCLYNHSAEPNVFCHVPLVDNLLIFEALRPIRQGEELFISYGNHWFKERSLPVQKTSIWHKIMVSRMASLLLRVYIACSGCLLVAYGLTIGLKKLTS